MTTRPTVFSRRSFLGSAAVGGAMLTTGNALLAQTSLGKPAPFRPLASGPADRVFIEREDGQLLAAEKTADGFAAAGVAVSLLVTALGTEIRVHCPRGPLNRVVLRWTATFPAETIFLGDAWERSYGDLQWRTLQPERGLPWYFAAHDRASGATLLCGVKTQPAALACWFVDDGGVSLWLDFRNGGLPSLPGDREIVAATCVSLVAADGESPFAATQRFCRSLCPAPLLPKAPVAGNNNWYYAYGKDFDADAMRRDAAFLAELAEGQKNRPFCVIDAGWSPGKECPGGPWVAGWPDKFPDMPGLAAEMKKIGVRPGIWIRPTALSFVHDPKLLRAGPAPAQEKPLDLTLPENLALIHADVARMRTWGYELIKHDFSTYDLSGQWGSQMRPDFSKGGWSFHDRSLTNAEIILRLYQTLRSAAGESLLLGCNTIGHLGAGLFEVQRTGDDTSGKTWERTRRMGVNTLAFRLPQHGAFFACDPDCAPHTERTPWELDRQFLDLVARSGTTLFVSADPRTLTPPQKAAFREAMQLALTGGQPGGVEPLDWLNTTAPTMWRCGTEVRKYNWNQPFGTHPSA
jgi:alpha-galactosidase